MALGLELGAGEPLGVSPAGGAGGAGASGGSAPRSPPPWGPGFGVSVGSGEAVAVGSSVFSGLAVAVASGVGGASRAGKDRRSCRGWRARSRRSPRSGRSGRGPMRSGAAERRRGSPVGGRRVASPITAAGAVGARGCAAAVGVGARGCAAPAIARAALVAAVARAGVRPRAHARDCRGAPLWSPRAAPTVAVVRPRVPGSWRRRGGSERAPGHPAGRLRRGLVADSGERPLERVDEVLGGVPAIRGILRESAFEHRVNGAWTAPGCARRPAAADPRRGRARGRRSARPRTGACRSAARRRRRRRA